MKDIEENTANMNDVKKNKCISFGCVEIYIYITKLFNNSKVNITYKTNNTVGKRLVYRQYENVDRFGKKWHLCSKMSRLCKSV